MDANRENITLLLGRLSQGDRGTVEELIPLVYNHMKVMARRHLVGERESHTLNTTALVHEAYIKLVNHKSTDWKNRVHFFAIASTSMRRILIDYARKRKASKRGGNNSLVTLNDEIHGQELRPEKIIMLDEALTTLKGMDERQAAIVEYRFFGGLTNDEIAEVLHVSVPTIKREWRSARAWLGSYLKG